MEEKPTTKPKILLIGNFGAGNLGDELILNAAIKESERDFEVFVMTANADHSQSFTQKKFKTLKPFPTGFRSLLSFFLNKKFVQEYKGLDFEKIIFPGGGLFAIKLRAYFIWGITRAWVSRFYPKSSVIWTHQGIDSTKNVLKRFMIKQSIKNDNISVRDAQSQQFLHKMGYENVKNVGDRAEKWAQNENFGTTKRTKVLINARSKVSLDLWRQKIGNINPNDVIFVAMDKSDLPFAPKGIKSVYPKTKTELLSYFSSAQMAMGERLHFLLCARALGVQNVFLLREAYAQKIGNMQF